MRKRNGERRRPKCRFSSSCPPLYLKVNTITSALFREKVIKRTDGGNAEKPTNGVDVSRLAPAARINTQGFLPLGVAVVREGSRREGRGR
nr:unnamed protein product [Digitaria exilis]